MQAGGTPMQSFPSSSGHTTIKGAKAHSNPDTDSEADEQRLQQDLTDQQDETPKTDVATAQKKAANMLQHANVNGHNMNGAMTNGQPPNGTNNFSAQGIPQQQQQQQSHPNGQQQANQHHGGTQGVNSTPNGSMNGANGAQLVYPALHLQPLNDTFAPKQISLSPPGPHNKVKVGRTTNAKTVPQPSNGHFDSKVLSRMHAEVWSQDGKVYIKDVKSSNGTFINYVRLSPEGQESDAFELHSDDVVEFGIDIVGEDGKTIIHHKVSCRAFLVMTAEEALGLRQDFAALYRGGLAGSTLNHHSVGPGAEGGLRRSKVGMGNGYSTHNGTTLMSFDHILHKLQAELQKSRETAGELGNLNSSMNDIHETLGGGLPPMQQPPYQHMVPSLNGERDAHAPNVEQQKIDDKARATSEALIKDLEEQVRETQRALTTHMERLSGLEARLEEHDGVKMDVHSMRSQVEEARRELAEAARLRTLATQKLQHTQQERGFLPPSTNADGNWDFDDDGMSVASMDTVVQGTQLDRSGDEGGLANRTAQNVDEEDDALDDAETLQRLKSHVGPPAPPDGVPAPQADSKAVQDDGLTARLEAIERQLERALEVGRTLAGQNAEATEAVKRLEERVKVLESDQTGSSVAARSETPDMSHAADAGKAALAGAGSAAIGSAGILAILEEKWGQWRKAFESDFANEKATLLHERSEVQRVVKMWDQLNADVEDVLETNTGEDEAAEESGSVAADASPSLPPISASKAVNKRRRRRKAAAAAATTASSPSTSSLGLSTSTTASRTQAINRELRSLLYTDEYNALVNESHLAAQRVGVDEDDDPVPAQTRGAGKDQPEPSATTAAPERIQSERDHAAKKDKPGDVDRGGVDNQVALPMLSVAGVVFVGMTAWFLTNGKGVQVGDAFNAGIH